MKNPIRMSFIQSALIVAIGYTALNVESQATRSVNPEILPSKFFYNSQAEFTLKPGNKRTITLLDLMLPFFSRRGKDLFFLDLRATKDNKSSREANLGLAYRRAIDAWMMEGDPVILGGYAYYDTRKSPKGFNYRQGTLGFEALHPWWQFRVNGYYPDRRQHVVQGAPGVFTGFSYNLKGGKEGAMPGFDSEVGVRVPWPHLPQNQEIFLFAGGYQFKRKGYETIGGPRVRGEYWNYDVLNSLGLRNSRLKLGAEAAYDSVRGNTAFFEIGLMIPLNVFGKPMPYNSFDRTMTLPIQRDVDIVAETVDTPLSTNGSSLRFLHVNGNAAAGGDGSAERPFKTIQGAVDAALTQVSVYPNPLIMIHPTNATGGDAHPDYQANLSTLVNIDAPPTALQTITLMCPATSFSTSNGALTATGRKVTLKTITTASNIGSTLSYINAPNLSAELIIRDVEAINQYDDQALGFSFPVILQDSTSTVRIINSTITGQFSADGIGGGNQSFANHTICINSTITAANWGAQYINILDLYGSTTVNTNVDINTINNYRPGLPSPLAPYP